MFTGKIFPLTSTPVGHGTVRPLTHWRTGGARSPSAIHSEGTYDSFSLASRSRPDPDTGRTLGRACSPSRRRPRGFSRIAKPLPRLGGADTPALGPACPVQRRGLRRRRPGGPAGPVGGHPRLPAAGRRPRLPLLHLCHRRIPLYPV